MMNRHFLATDELYLLWCTYASTSPISFSVSAMPGVESSLNAIIKLGIVIPRFEAPALTMANKASCWITAR